MVGTPGNETASTKTERPEPCTEANPERQPRGGKGHPPELVGPRRPGGSGGKEHPAGPLQEPCSRSRGEGPRSPVPGSSSLKTPKGRGSPCSGIKLLEARLPAPCAATGEATRRGRGSATAGTDPRGEGNEGLGTCLPLSNTSCRHLDSHHPLPRRRAEPGVTWRRSRPGSKSRRGGAKGRSGATLPRLPACGRLKARASECLTLQRFSAAEQLGVLFCPVQPASQVGPAGSCALPVQRVPAERLKKH